MKSTIKFLLFTVIVFIFTSYAFSQVPNYVPTNGLVGYWPFNGNANDESGNGNNGTVNGAALTIDRYGNINNAYFFNHTDEILTNYNGLSGSQPRTISFWMKNQNSSKTINPIWYGGDPNQPITGSAFNIIFNRNEQNDPCNCWPTTYEGIGISADWIYTLRSTIIGDNQWHHWLVSLENAGDNFNQVKYYKDGVLISASIIFDYNNNGSTIVNTSNISPLKFGKSSGLSNNPDRAATEYLDDIGVWNRALTPQEITNLYTSTVPVSCLPAYVPTSGLVGYWPFCGNANDESGNGNNGTVNGATLTSDRNGNINSAFSFDGVNDYIDLGNNSNFNINTPKTYSFWTKDLNHLDFQSAYLSKNTGYGAQNKFIIGRDANSGNFFLHTQTTLNNGNWYNSNLPSSNNWYHVIVSVDANTLSFYSNGLLVYSSNIINPTQPSNAPLLIGISEPTFTFHGLMDDLGIWNRALTPQEITNLYTSTVPVSCLPAYVPTSGLVGYWPFCGNANDESGNGNNGTVNGATLTTDRNGVVDKAYSFDGSSWIDILSNGAASGNNKITLSAWVYRNSLPNSVEYIFCYGSTGNEGIAFGMGEYGSQGIFTTFMGSQFDAISNIPLSINSWHNITSIHHQNGIIEIYLDGNLTFTTNVQTPNIQNILGRIGKSIYGNEFWNGKIDDIGIWNRALTQQEITNLYTSTVPPSVAVLSGDATICAGASTNLSVAVTGGTAPYTVTVTDGTNNYSATGASPVSIAVSPTATSTYSIVSVTGGGTGTGNTGTATVTVIDVTITASDSTICAGETTTLSVTQGGSSNTACAALPTNLQSGLVGYWPFCGNAIDESGNGNNGVVYGATLTTDRFGSANSAYSFDGNSNKIIIGSSSTFNPGYADFSISGWIKTTDASGIICSKSLGDSQQNPQNNDWYVLHVNSGKLEFELTDGYSGPGDYVLLQSTITINDGLFHFFTFVFDRDGNGSIYIDNELNNSTAISGFQGDISPLTNLEFGYDTEHITNYLFGVLDDINYWNRIVTEQEITQLYNTGQATYLWSNGATNPTINVSPTSTTTYSCTVTTNGVSCTDSVTVVVNNPTIDLGSDVTACGTSTTLTAPTGYDSYVWSNDATTNTTTVTSNGTYSCTVTQGGCSASDSIDVTLIDATISASDSTICAGETTTLSVPQGGSSNTACAALPTNLQTGLVGYWPFCGNANDESGNGNNGTVNGATLTTDRFGSANSAYSFDGNDYIEVPDNASLNNSNISIGLWMKTNSSIYQQVLYKVSLNTAQNEEYSVPINLLSPNQINFDIKNNTCLPGIGWMSFTNNANLSSWVHVSFTHDGSNTKFYINGIFINSQVANYNVANCPGGKLIMGIAWDLQNGLNGQLDDIAIYNRALSTSEIQQLYIQGQTSYSWSTGATTPSINVSPTTTTTYTCTVTTNGVSCTDSVTVVVNNPTIDLGSDVTVCGTSTTLTAPTGYDSYVWSNGATTNTTTVISNGTYSCTVTQGGCSASDSIDVTLIDATISASDSVICAGETVTLSVPQGGSSNTACAALPTNLQTGLVGYWPFCGNANDVSGNGNNGTVNGATLTTDRFGSANSAYSFDGVSDFIQTELVGPTSNASRSISYWMKSSSDQPYMTVLGYGDNNLPNNDFHIWHNWSCNGLNVNLSNAATTYVTGEIDNLWQNYIVVFDNALGDNLTNIKVYKNGEQLTETCVEYGNGSVDTGAEFPICIGKYHAVMQHYFNGLLDDILVYNYALSPLQMQQLYNSDQSSYSWSTGATTPTISVSPTTTTTYTCTTTTNGVSCTDSVTVVVNNPTIDLGSDVTACGTSTTLTAPAGFDSYLWSNGATTNTTTVTSNGTYSCTVTQGGCSASDTIDVTLIDATISASDSVICAGETVTLSVTQGGSSNTACAALPTNLQTGLVGYWPFCGNANDASGNGNNGTVNGATLTTDRFGNANSAFSLSGTSNSILVNDSPSLDFPQGVFSLCAEVKLSGLGVEQGLIDHVDLGGPSVLSRYTLRVLPNNKIRFNLKDDENDWSSVDSDISLDVNVWYSIVGVFNYATQELHIYINGEIHDGTIIYNALTGPAITPPNSLFLGNFAGAYNLNGTIDNVSIYNRALSPSDIQQIYNLEPTTYLWSTGATTPTINVSPTSTTTYTCTVTTNGVSCIDSVTVVVNNPGIDLGANVTLCGTSTTLTAPSGYDSYLWSNGATTNTTTVSANGTYSCTVTQGGCSAADSIDVTLIDATITASDSVICAGETVTLSVPQGGSSNTACAALPTNLQTGLVGYWPFCGNANDESGNGNNGTVNGATLTTDRFGSANSAYSFDGVNDFISLTPSFFNNGWNNYSISVWISISQLNQIHQTIYNTSPHDGEVFSWNHSSNISKFTFWKNQNTNIGLWNIFNSAPMINNDVYQDVWTNFIITKEDNNYRFYKNGQLDHLSNTSLQALQNFCSINLGSIMGNSEFFNGSIDDFMVFERTLSAAEIQQLYTPGQSTYLWSTGATTPTINVSPTSTTTYTCTVTTNGVSCTDEVTVVVSNPVIDLGANVTACGTSTTLTAPTGFDSYLWSNGATTNTTTVSANGTYSCTVTQGGCSASDSIDVTLIDATISASDSVICAGETVTLSVPQGGSSNTACAALPTNLQTGLVGYWPFCGNANDESGNGNNGTVNGATLTTDRFGSANSAYSFDGGSAFISLSAAFFNGSTSVSSLSYSTWVNINTLPANGTSFAISNKEGYWRSIGLSINSDGSFSFGGSQPSPQGYFGISSQPNSISSNTWSLLSVTFSNGVLKLYKDGVQVATTTASYSQLNYSYLQLGNSTSTNHFGAAQPVSPGLTSFFNGTIDEFATWNRELTATEIQQLYTLGQSTYLWSTGATTATINVTPTTTTTYTCTVTTNGVSCSDTVTVVVSNSVIDLGADVTVCGTSTTLTAASGYDSYLWSNGGTTNTTTVTTNGTYSCTVSQGGCSASDSIDVTFIDATISASDSVICAGETVTLSTNNIGLGSGLPNYSLFHQAGGYFADPNNDDYVVFPVSSTLNTNYSSWTMECWAKIMSPSEEGILSIGNPEHGGGNVIYSGWSNTFAAGSNTNAGGGGSTSSYNYAPGVWNHYALSYQYGTYYLFFNGVLKESWVSGSSVAINNMYPLMTNTHWWWRSGDLSSHRMTVYYDDIRVSKVCRYTSNFIPNTNWNNDANTIGLWNFNEGSGNTALDNSGNLNNGIIHGASYSSDVPEVLGSNISLNYSCLWSNGATTSTINVSPTSTTTYTCTTTINGVSCTDSVTVIVNNPIINLGSDVTVCGTSTTLTAPSGYDSYLWSNGGTTNTTTVSANGTYSCTVTQGLCSATDSIDVTLIDATISASDSVICAGETVTLSVTQGGSSNTACAALPTNLQTGLVGYWPFCGNANDESGNGNNGTVNGATLTTDRFGSANSAYHFNGSALVSMSVNHTDVTDYSVLGWMKSTSDFGGTFVQVGADDGLLGCNGFAIGKGGNTSLNSDSGNNLVALASCVSWYPTSTLINPTQDWHQFAMVKNVSSFKLYIDGTLVHTINNGTVNFPSPYIFIGGNGPSSQVNTKFYGDLDDITTINRSLSSTEIQQFYSLGLTTYLWSNGATTPSINVSPTTTTTYTCTTTTNGVSCSSNYTITVNNSSASTNIVTAFDSFTWLDGNTYTESNNTATYTTTNAAGCDSVISLNLTITTNSATLSLQVFLDGYYINSLNPAAMTAARYNNLVASGSANPGVNTDVDVITVELRSPSNLDVVAYSVSPILQTNGSVQCVFPAGALGGTFYIVVKHRAAIPLWSAVPMLISNGTAINFSNNVLNSFSDGDPLYPSVHELNPGLYGLWMGELYYDSYLDGNDYPLFEVDVNSSSYADLYLLNGDLNGNTYVDASDYSVFNYNTQQGVYEQRPYAITTNVSIGQSYQGGIVAYILQPGDPGYDASVQHGLIAAPSDQGIAQWGCYGTEISGADATAIGTGAQNTIDILNGCSTAGIPARLCGDLVLGGYSDWYLPSKDELNKLYINRVAIGGFGNYGYWSSSEGINFLIAWGIDFSNTYLDCYSKNGLGGARAVRAF